LNKSHNSYWEKHKDKVGIVVHSTGCNNTTIKRYVQPSDNDPNRNEILADIGKNKYGNDWNHTTRYGGVHAFIGKNAKGVIETYEVLPYEWASWGVGRGKNGSYNYAPTAHIQFEICEDNLTSADYFNKAFKEAIEYCAYLCKKFGWDSNAICSHKESVDRGYGQDHGDPDHWLKKYGKNMNWFRAEVQKLLGAEKDTDETPKEFEPYLVKITAKALNIRKGPGTDTKIVGVIEGGGIFTIVEEREGKGATLWGKLKSGAGWISLDYTKKYNK
jgi:hypothetical protein